MTCQLCWHRRAAYAVAWKTPTMPAPAYLYLCHGDARDSRMTFRPGTRVRVRVLRAKPSCRSGADWAIMS